jgi:rod shape-determining protein MreC
MKNLIRFLLQNGYPLVFVFFQVITFYIIFNNTYFQQSTLYRVGTNFTGKISEKRSSITDYLDLSEANDRLANENAMLHNQNISSYVIVDKGFSLINDTLYKVKYRYAPAKVINSTYSKIANFITLDKGTKSGFRENMGVINDQGLVGVITSISDNYSIVLPIIHPKAMFSVMVKDKHYFGLLKWDGKQYDVAKMNDVSNHAQLLIGDTIVTRETTIFPEGIPVGKIKDFEPIKGSNFLNISVELFADYSKVYQVYCVENVIADEQIELENDFVE